MANLLELEKVSSILERAFAPLECVVELQDYRHRVGFRIYSPDNEPLVTVEGTLAQQARNPHGLADLIGGARRKVEAGLKLLPWSMPDE
jgi:hypothetical protein